MKDRSADPRALDVAALCRAGGRLEGRSSLAEFPRLAGSVLADADGPAAEVHWSAEGSSRPVPVGVLELWLALRAAVPVRLECQRCLQPLNWELTVAHRVRFVHGEQEAERLDEELEDDVLALEPRLDLLALLEDELILALPLVPRHDRCPQSLPVPGGDLHEEPAPHPFAALAKLRGGSS
jgi:uncharacterized protein